jgi:hypothetical protein
MTSCGGQKPRTEQTNHATERRGACIQALKHFLVPADIGRYGAYTERARDAGRELNPRRSNYTEGSHPPRTRKDEPGQNPAHRARARTGSIGPLAQRGTATLLCPPDSIGIGASRRGGFAVYP